MKLAIFKVNQLGDNVVFLPVVQALRRQFPDWQLFLYTSPTAAELFEADLPHSQMLLMPTNEFNGAWKHPGRLLQLILQARAKRFDASLLAPDQGNVAHFLARWAGGGLRVGVRPEFIKISRSLSEAVSFPPDLQVARQAWEIARALVLRLGGQWAEMPPPPDLSHLTGSAVPIRKRIVIHCGASLAYKRWPAERFESLANRLSEDFEVLWIEQPHVSAPDLSSSVQRIAPASLREFVGTLRTASLLVGNNSGPMNLAAVIGCPTIVLSGPSHPMWDPLWHRERVLILRDEALACLPCDTTLRPAQVCQNAASPHACLLHWTVDEVEARSRGWIGKWADSLAPQATPSPTEVPGYRREV